MVAAPWLAGTPSGAPLYLNYKPLILAGANASNFLEGMRIMAAPWAAGTPSGAHPT